MFSSSNGDSLLSAEQTNVLIVQPLTRQATAAIVSNNLTTGEHELRIPRVVSDPTAGWTSEGQEITTSEPEVDEVIVTPAKLAALTVVSRELAHDSTPSAAAIVGDGITRDLARRVDEAYFGALTAPAPSGLAALDGVTELTSDLTNLDVFVDAVAAVAQANGRITSWVAHPNTAAQIAKLKQAQGSNVALLGASDPTQSARHTIEGMELHSTPAVAEGTVWGISRDHAHYVTRQTAELVTDESAFFTSDRVAIRATMRIGFGFTNPAAIAKITIS